MPLRNNPDGGYRYLTGIAPYSAAVCALPGYTIARAVLRRPLPYREGFAVAERHMAAEGRTRRALCAVELRSPAPFSLEGFMAYNAEYRQLLEEWRVLIDGDNPIARTNVAPALGAPSEVSLHAFSYTVPAEVQIAPTFVVAGAGELRDQTDLTLTTAVRPGETSPAAMLEKAAFVLEVMTERLVGVDSDWSQVTETSIYTVWPVHEIIVDALLPRLGPAGVHGLTHYHSRPPIVGVEFEMDVAAVARQIWL